MNKLAGMEFVVLISVLCTWAIGMGLGDSHQKTSAYLQRFQISASCHYLEFQPSILSLTPERESLLGVRDRGDGWNQWGYHVILANTSLQCSGGLGVALQVKKRSVSLKILCFRFPKNYTRQSRQKKYKQQTMLLPSMPPFWTYLPRRERSQEFSRDYFRASRKSSACGQLAFNSRSTFSAGAALHIRAQVLKPVKFNGNKITCTVRKSTITAAKKITVRIKKRVARRELVIPRVFSAFKLTRSSGNELRSRASLISFFLQRNENGRTISMFCCCSCFVYDLLHCWWQWNSSCNNLAWHGLVFDVVRCSK